MGNSFKSPSFVLSFGFTSVVIFCAIFANWLVSENNLLPDLPNELQTPSWSRPLGKAENGVDILSWLIVGARNSLLVAGISTSIGLVVGFLYGAISGLSNPHIDRLMMRLVDILLAFPSLLLAIYIAAVLNPSVTSLVFALTATRWVGFARLVRAQTLQIKKLDYVTAAKALGATQTRIITRHVLPNLSGLIAVEATFALSSTILAESTLSFLGLGLAPGTPSWGSLLDQGVAYLFIAPHVALFAGLAITLTILSLNVLGNAAASYYQIQINT